MSKKEKYLNLLKGIFGKLPYYGAAIAELYDEGEKREFALTLDEESRTKVAVPLEDMLEIVEDFSENEHARALLKEKWLLTAPGLVDAFTDIFDETTGEEGPETALVMFGSLGVTVMITE